MQVSRSASGLGLFAKEKITQGKLVSEYTGDLISTEEAELRGGKYLFQIDSKWAIDGKGRENLSRYINHSCQPNCEVQIRRKQILIFALRNIEVGEQLGYDYGKEYFYTYIKPMGCKCAYCTSRKGRK